MQNSTPGGKNPICTANHQDCMKNTTEEASSSAWYYVSKQKKANMVLGLQKEGKHKILSSFTATECLMVTVQSVSAGEKRAMASIQQEGR